ncbi:hypothetical protein DXG01_000980 [Tephrocybe rancida]|nr:hypothetical protein DXG01_000980 [Tephrocybe rancida]
MDREVREDREVLATPKEAEDLEEMEATMGTSQEAEEMEAEEMEAEEDLADQVIQQFPIKDYPKECYPCLLPTAGGR